ncbi:MAG TPA: hypothetical protein VFV99_02670 [Kofleriaceae bacterium]|nr:hypothetical protein [Kofleriaceae bacterium]
MVQELTAETDIFYYFGRTDIDVTFRGDWKAFFLPTPRTEASLAADASYGQINALSASIVSNENPLQVMPTGNTNTANVAASEGASWVATEFVSLFQRGFARYTTTDNNDPMTDVSTRSFEGGAGIGFERRMRYDSFSLEAGASYVYFKKNDPFFRQMGPRLDEQVNPRMVGVWAHDFNKKWSAALNGGAVYVYPTFNLTGDTKPALFPTYGLTGAYTDVWGRAQVFAGRVVTPNLFIAENTVADSLNAAAAMPLTFLDKDSRKRAPKVVGIGSAGVERTQLIDPTNGELTGSFLVARVDAAVAWQPRSGQTLGMRAELTYQDGDTIGEMVVPSYHRFTFYFTYALRWPEDVGVRVPRRNNSVRADKSDLAPIGAEPVVIDPADLLEEGQGDR